MRRGLTAWGLALWPTLAAAHGPAPAALGTAGPASDPARVVHTSIGLAVRRGDGAYGYRCPGAWGEEDRVAPAVSLADGTVVVAAGGAAYRSPPGGCGFASTPLAGAGTVAAVVVSAEGDAAWVATREGADSSIWRVPAEGPAERRFALADAEVTDLALGPAELLAAAARPEPMVIGLGAGEPRREVVQVGPASYLGLRAQGRFLHATLPEGPRLFERREDGDVEVLRAFTSLRGPVVEGEGLLALTDGVIQARGPGDDAFVAGDETRWTCLEEVAGQIFVCADRRLHRRVAGGLEEVFRLEDLVGVDCEALAACESQWLHFGGEAGLVRLDAGIEDAGLAGVDAGAGAAGAEGGCAQAPGPATPWGLLLVLAVRRRRQGRR
ncbi:MAG: hypothetical protein R3F60_05420 [bacterium]